MAEERPDVVVLDVMMPGLDGASVTQLVRADPELAGTKVLLYSAMEEDRLAAKAAECGADGHVAKTAGPLAVVRAVERLLEPT